MSDMNSFELAILRILLKRHIPIKISDLISGFPDNSECSILEAINRLHSLGYVSIDHHTHFQHTLLLTEEKRKKALEIVSSNTGNRTQIREDFYKNQIINPSIKNNSGTSKPLLIAMIGTTAFSIVLSGLVIILVNSQPSSFDNLNPSHYFSGDQLPPLLVSTYTYTDTPTNQYTGWASIPELTDSIVLVRLGSLDEPPTGSMDDEVFTTSPHNGTIPTIL